MRHHLPRLMGGTVEVRIAGIPAKVEAVYTRGYPYPEDPDNPSELEIRDILDRKGYKAKWLEDKLDKMDKGEYQRFEDDVVEALVNIYEANLQEAEEARAERFEI